MFATAVALILTNIGLILLNQLTPLVIMNFMMITAGLIGCLVLTRFYIMFGSIESILVMINDDVARVEAEAEMRAKKRKL
jgi:hypothetical protein